MDVNQVYLIIQFAVEKNQNGYVSPDDFNNVLMPTAQRNYLDYLVGEYQKYQAGRPIAVVEIGQNQKLRESVAPLIYNILLTPNTTTGISAVPSDWEMTDAMWGVYNFSRIRFAQQDQLDSYYNSVIDPIATNPIYLIKHEGFQFYPENIGFAKLSYVRTPPSIIWDYTEINGEPVYNPATSVNPVWSDIDMYNIIVRALMLVGVSLQLGTVMQYAQTIKEGGQ